MQKQNFGDKAGGEDGDNSATNTAPTKNMNQFGRDDVAAGIGISQTTSLPADATTANEIHKVPTGDGGTSQHSKTFGQNVDEKGDNFILGRTNNNNNVPNNGVDSEQNIDYISSLLEDIYNADTKVRVNQPPKGSTTGRKKNDDGEEGTFDVDYVNEIIDNDIIDNNDIIDGGASYANIVQATVVETSARSVRDPSIGSELFLSHQLVVRVFECCTALR